MNQLISGIKFLIGNFIRTCSTAEPVENDEDYKRVKAWVIKVGVLYGAFSVFALIEIIYFFSTYEFADVPLAFVYILCTAMLFLFNWGIATLIIYLTKIAKGVISSGKSGYGVGEKIETTHIQVTHEFANNYRVTAYKENKGCLFAVIAGVAKLMVWLFFCVYVGPFITFKRIFKSVKNLKSYKAA